MSGVLSVGSPAELAGVREQRGWSQADVAQRLKLRVRQLDALERGDWEALPGRAFIRGTLRAYARLLEVDIDPLLKVVGGFAQAEELRPSASLGTQMPRSGGFGFDGDTRGNRLPWALLGVLGVIALAVFFGRDGEMTKPSQWFGLPPAATPSGSAKPPVAGGSSPTDSPTDASGATGSPTVPVDAAAAPTLVVPMPKLANGDPTPGVTGAGLGQASGSSTSNPVTSASPGTTGAPGGSSDAPRAASAEPERAVSTLRVTVRQDAWIEVRQADGQTVFSATVKPGSPVDIDAKKPVSMVIGNANQVSLEFEGKSVDLKPQTVMPNNIAKVKLP